MFIEEVKQKLTTLGGPYNAPLFRENENAYFTNMKNLAETMPGICNRLGIRNHGLDSFFCYQQVMEYLEPEVKESYFKVVSKYRHMNYLSILREDWDSFIEDFVIPFMNGLSKVPKSGELAFNLTTE